MRLSSREYYFIGIGSFALLAVLFYVAVYEPVERRINLMTRQVDSQNRRYEELNRLYRGYAPLRDSLDNIKGRLKRSKDFSILSNLENTASRLMVRDRITQMKPKQGQATRYYKESLVEIKMEKVNLQTLVNYLYAVDNSPELLRVKDLKIRPRFDNPNLVDAIFEVSAYEAGET